MAILQRITTQQTTKKMINLTGKQNAVGEMYSQILGMPIVGDLMTACQPTGESEPTGEPTGETGEPTGETGEPTGETGGTGEPTGETGE